LSVVVSESRIVRMRLTWRDDGYQGE
jgi:hypothetical protein